MTSKQDKARRFNGFMPIVNETWAAQALNMQVNPHNGPDLIDSNKFVEIKFTLVSKEGNYPKAWTVLEHQIDYINENYETGFWGLGLYKLNTPVSEIKTKKESELEDLVISRELYIVQWDWIYQFNPSNTSGKTEISEWKNTFRYPKLNKIPEIIQSYPVNKGIIHLTQETQKHYFPHLKTQ